MPPFWKRTHKTDTRDFYDSGELDRSDYLSYNEHADQLPSLQTNLVRKVEYSDPKTRWLHTKANGLGNKHTYGLVNAIFYNQPFPFKYIDKKQDDIKTAEGKPEMDALHEEWDKVDMFRHFKEVQAQAEGVGSAWIIRLTEEQYIVLNPANIELEYFWRNPKTLKLEEVWFRIPGTGYNSKGPRDANAHKMEDLIVKAKIGVNAVEYQPYIDVTTDFGRSGLLPIWAACIYTAANHYFSTIYNKKGGIGGRTLMAPDSMSSTSKRVFKKEALKGLESELLEVYYPKALVAQGMDPAKIVTWNESKGGNPNFSETDSMLARESPLPPSFTQGPETGALGGKAPVEDNKTINRFLMSYTAKVQKLVKDINTVFFDYEQDDYMIIPYFMDETDPMTMGKIDPETGKPLIDPKFKGEKDDQKPKEKDKSAPPKESANTRTADVEFLRVDAKVHKKNAPVIYRGNMLSSGFYEYHEVDPWTGKAHTTHEYLDGNEIKSFIDDPLSIREVYLDLEHNQMTDVHKGTAIGKVVIKGHTTANGITKDNSEIHFNSKWDPKHEKIFLSPIYAVQLKDSGKVYNGEKALSQTNVSIINCSLCHYPRSSLTGLDTSAVRDPSSGG